jgi:hypothetical protein
MFLTTPVIPLYMKKKERVKEARINKMVVRVSIT